MGKGKQGGTEGALTRTFVPWANTTIKNKFPAPRGINPEGGAAQPPLPARSAQRAARSAQRAARRATGRQQPLPTIGTGLMYCTYDEYYYYYYYYHHHHHYYYYYYYYYYS